jgi:hypothetical protein
MSEQEKLKKIEKFVSKVIRQKGDSKSKATLVRKEIGKIWGLKKTARNEKFRKLYPNLFGYQVVRAASIVPLIEMSKDESFRKGVLDRAKKSAAPKVDVKGDKATVEVKLSPVIYTLDELVKVCGIDLNEWVAKSFVANSYGQNFQAKAEFARKKEAPLKQILEEFLDDALNYSPNVDKIKYEPVKDGKLLVVNLADAHIGKLSNKENCSHNYDLKIAKEIYLKTLKDLIIKAKKQGDIEQIWYIAGNDYLTIDTPQNTTTKGTPQDVDTRFSKIFREGRRLLVESIEILKEIAPVHVIVMPGNHDRSAMFHLGDALECWYRNDKNVTVDNEDKLRKYYSYGDNAFGIAHGDTIKQDKLVQMGLVEYGEKWGVAKRRFWFVGHIHHLKCQNYQGQEIWTFPSVSGSDDFHQANGYVGSTRTALAMIFGKNNLEAVFQAQPIEDRDYQ